MHNRGYHKFPSKLFLFHSAEKCRRGTLSLISGIEEVWMRGCGGGGVSRFSVENFLSHRTETKSFVKEPSVFGKFSGIEKNLWIREGISRFSVEIFMSHSAENFRKGILLFLRKFLVKNVL